MTDKKNSNRFSRYFLRLWIICAMITAIFPVTVIVFDGLPEINSDAIFRVFALSLLGLFLLSTISFVLLTVYGFALIIPALETKLGKNRKTLGRLLARYFRMAAAGSILVTLFMFCLMGIQ